MAGERNNVVVVDGRSIKVTHPDKVIYPADNLTKVAVIAYYVGMAQRMLPHMTGRPVTRIRWPDGVSGSRFFEKQLPAGAPDWVETLTLDHSDGPVTYPLAPDAATLAWLAQLNALELHVPQWRWIDDEPQIDRLVLDLDPGPGTGLSHCVEVAQWLHDKVAEDDMVTVPVTSGSKGLHLYAAWTPSDHDQSTSEYRSCGGSTRPASVAPSSRTTSGGSRWAGACWPRTASGRPAAGRRRSTGSSSGGR